MQTPKTRQTPVRAATLRTQLRALLKSRDGLRQAVLLTEVLAPPVATRAARSRPVQRHPGTS